MSYCLLKNNCVNWKRIKMITSFRILLINLLPTITGQFTKQSCTTDICYKKDFTKVYYEPFSVDEERSLCNGKTCGGFTYDMLADGYKDMFLSMEKITKLQELIHKDEHHGIIPESSETETLQHDQDKCCPTAQLLELHNSLPNIYGQARTIVQYDDFKQPVHVGNCVSVPGGCLKCQQSQRLHVLLALDPGTGHVFCDVFYVNNHCACVQN